MEPTSIGQSPKEQTPSGQEDAIIKRHFTAPGWEPRSIPAKIVDVDMGNHKQAGVTAPLEWGKNAVDVTSKLYFATVNGQKEHSVYALVHRVAAKITDEGVKHGYFEGIKIGEDRRWGDEAQTFYDELSFLLLNQMAAFNTPVWLNVGVPNRPQICSACFLLAVEDSMVDGDHSILNWIGTESRIFKGGAGAGINLSKLRGSMEKLSTGGIASGPTSYMRFADAGAGTLKSGGAHRRAAKMVILEADHPDIRDFIQCKVREDKRMLDLKAAGHEIDPFTASGEKTIAEATSFQNANLSVGASNDFMHAATGDDDSWYLPHRTNPDKGEEVSAKSLLQEIAEAAWTCGDPGMVFLDRVNEWHTTPSLGPVSVCNPCGEVFIGDDGACNLASLNLGKFLGEYGSFKIDDYRQAIDVMILAMDITCSFSDLPTKAIEENTRKLRQLGLGYANLGGALMSQGIPYDSDEGRDWAQGVTALLTGRAYARSAELAKKMGHYHYWGSNKTPHLQVIGKHREALGAYRKKGSENFELWAAAHAAWEAAWTGGAMCGFRNSQVTVLAPTGTISIMMGCDSSGIEPPFALTTHKGLAGGGSMTIEVSCAQKGREARGYEEGEEIKPDDAVFHCANEISPVGHVAMLTALAPLISGAPSKTVNLPESATVSDIRDIYIKAWRGGAKAVSVYRNNSKATQVLSHKPAEKKITVTGKITTEHVGFPAPAQPERKRMPRERQSITHKLYVDNHEGYITVGLYDDGAPGELFFTDMGKEGTFLQGMMNSWAVAVSIGLQYGVPLETYCRKFIGMEFEPKGKTGLADMPHAKSIPDYVFRWLASRFLDADTCEELGVMTKEVKQKKAAALDAQYDQTLSQAAQVALAYRLNTTSGANANGKSNHIMSTKLCSCGGVMIPSGSCYTCQSCFSTTGCA